MAENILISGYTKEEKYNSLIPQIKSLFVGETDIVANLANTVAALKFGMNFFWVGFYIVKDNELVLGPFQGPIACTRIQKGRGVCGFTWEKKEAVLVDDVEKFPGHIACSSASKSEIVLPVLNRNKEVIAVLDVDQDFYSAFDAIDKRYLTLLCEDVSLLFEHEID